MRVEHSRPGRRVLHVWSRKGRRERERERERVTRISLTKKLHITTTGGEDASRGRRGLLCTEGKELTAASRDGCRRQGKERRSSTVLALLSGSCEQANCHRLPSWEGARDNVAHGEAARLVHQDAVAPSRVEGWWGLGVHAVAGVELAGSRRDAPFSAFHF